MAIERIITKQPGGIEDLTLGNSTETQLRNGVNRNVTQVGGASLPIDAKGGTTIKTAVEAAQTTAITAQTTANAAQADATTALDALPTKVDKTSATGSAILPAGTTAQRDVTPTEGYTRINTETQAIEVYVGGVWNSLGTVAELGATTLIHNMTADVDYTLLVAENFYGRIVITDTSIFLTTGRNIILSTAQRVIFVQNNTAQALTFKTAAGTGVTVKVGDSIGLISDGTNIVKQVETAVPIQYDYPMIMGDASLGDVTYTATTNLDSGAYQYKNLTIDAGIVLTPTESVNAWWIFVVQETFTLAGVLNLSSRGSAGGANGDPSGPGTDGYFGGSGGEGGYNATYRGGDALYLAGGNTGALAGADGQACSTLTISEQYLRERINMVAPNQSSLATLPSLGGGGGSGGRDGATVGTSGGDAGGGVLVICDTFDFQATGAFQSTGANSSSSAFYGTGGGGGGGAMIVFARNIINDAGSVSVAGGVAGSSPGGHSGGDGGAGYFVIITPTSRSQRTV